MHIKHHGPKYRLGQGPKHRLVETEGSKHRLGDVPAGESMQYIGLIENAHTFHVCIDVRTREERESPAPNVSCTVATVIEIIRFYSGLRTNLLIRL